jgi:CRISPR-associated protein Csb3
MSFSVNVDPTNPGQFFACCGLLELADRLWPGAEGWFADGRFHTTCAGTLAELMTRFSQAQIGSSLSSHQLKRLGTLLSVAEAKLTIADLEEKVRLKEMWKFERLRVSPPFDVCVDWWRDEEGERTDLKTWAAKQMVAEMVQGMLGVIKAAKWSKSPNPDALFLPVQADCLPFNFDSDLIGQGSARGTGFSADTLGLKSEFRPLLELVAFVGMQRFRPAPIKDDKFRFCLWTSPLPPSVAAAAAAGAIGSASEQLYEFALFSRTKYMKSFLPAQPLRGAQ